MRLTQIVVEVFQDKLLERGSDRQVERCLLGSDGDSSATLQGMGEDLDLLGLLRIVGGDLIKLVGDSVSQTKA